MPSFAKTILAVILTLATATLAQAQQKTRVTLVGSSVNPPSVSNMYYLAASEGPFAKHGLDVQLQQSSGSPSSLAAVVSGRAEFASINMSTLANAAAEGVKGKIVVTGNLDFPGLILTRPDITTAKMLEGQKMASSAIGSIEYTVARAWLVKQNIDFSKVDWVSTRQSTVTTQMLMAGQIAGAWFNMASAVTTLQMAPHLYTLASAETLAKTVPTTGGIIVVTDKFAREHPELIQEFVEAIIEGNRMLYTDKAFFDAVVEKRLPGVYTPAQKKLLYDAYRASWGVNGGINMKIMGEALEGWKKDVNPDRAVNPNFSKIEDLVDARFARAALGKVGVFEGALDDAPWMK